MSSVEARIKVCIEQLIKELDLLFQQRTLESLRTLLAGAVAPAPRAPPLVRAAPGGSASREGLGERVRAHIRSSPGESIEQIARAVGGSIAAVKRSLQALLAARQVRRIGKKRDARYVPADARPGSSRKPLAAKPRPAKRGSAKPGRKPSTKRRGRKPRRSKEGTRRTKKATGLEKQRRAQRPKKRAPTRSPRRVVVPARRPRPPAVRPAEVQPAVGPVEASQPQLEFAE